MSEREPELITIIEGPTPDFRPTPQRWLQSILEGPEDRATAYCQLRTVTGAEIVDRCANAWRERRPVMLDFPDNMRARQRVDVVAMRLLEEDEGEVLHLWVALPFELEEEAVDDDEDGFHLS